MLHIPLQYPTCFHSCNLSLIFHLFGIIPSHEIYGNVSVNGIVTLFQMPELVILFTLYSLFFYYCAETISTF